MFCTILTTLSFSALLLASALQLPAASPLTPDAKVPNQQNVLPGATTNATYVGMEACRTCHEDVVKNFEKNSVHAELNTDKRRGFVNNACEACHGPASKHVETTSPADIIQPVHLVPRKSDSICLSCHLNQETQVGQIQSGHAHSQVTCMACHSIHHSTRETLVARKPSTVNQLCSSCHTSEWAEFYRPYAHRLTQNAMSCVDCHNPHGNFLPGNRQLFAANEPGCLRCHMEYRGPFPFEHAAIRIGGCTACHTPHGSSNPKLLTRHKVFMVCLECHSNVNPPATQLASQPKGIGGVAPSFHNLTNPLFQNCTLCHVKVHGSYASRFLEQ